MLVSRVRYLPAQSHTSPNMRRWMVANVSGVSRVPRVQRFPEHQLCAARMLSCSLAGQGAMCLRTCGS